MVSQKMKGKDWFKIVSPKFLGEAVIGETPTLDASKLIGRTIETSSTDITGDTSRYYVKLFFKVSEVSGDRAITKFFGHDTTRDFIARIVQTRTTRIDTVDAITLSDSVKMHVKSIAITNKPVSNLMETKLRKVMRDIILQEVSKLNSEQFVKEILSGSLQQKIKKTVSKVYPLRFFEFRKTEVL
jgi:small subunit ribosomal protein S3Ae